MSALRTELEIRPLTPDDFTLITNADDGVFDNPVNDEMARKFLADPRHHIVGAILSNRLVGVISAVEYYHLDKPHVEYWVNEVTVASSARGRGVGKELLKSALEIWHDAGCAEAWTLTETENSAANRLYSGISDEGPDDQVMYTFDLRR